MAGGYWLQKIQFQIEAAINPCLLNVLEAAAPAVVAEGLHTSGPAKAVIPVMMRRGMLQYTVSYRHSSGCLHTAGGHVWTSKAWLRVSMNGDSRRRGSLLL